MKNKLKGFWSNSNNFKDILNLELEGFSSEIENSKSEILNFYSRDSVPEKTEELYSLKIKPLIKYKSDFIVNNFGGYVSLYTAEYISLINLGENYKEKTANISIILMSLLHEIPDFISFASYDYGINLLYTDIKNHIKNIALLEKEIDNLYQKSYLDYEEYIHENAQNTKSEIKNRCIFYGDLNSEYYKKNYLKHKNTELYSEVIDFLEQTELNTLNGLLELFIAKKEFTPKEAVANKSNLGNTLRDYCRKMFQSEVRSKLKGITIDQLDDLAEKIYEYRLDPNNKNFNLNKKYIIADKTKKENSISSIKSLIKTALFSQF